MNLDAAAELWGEDLASAVVDGRTRQILRPGHGDGVPVPDPGWSTLRPGDRIDVFLDDGSSFTATVDTMTADLQAVWVFEHGHGRRMLNPYAEIRMRLVTEPTATTCANRH